MSYLTTRQVAERLKMDPKTVRALYHTGQLKPIDVSVKPGGQARYRVSEEELERFQRRREVSFAPVVRRKRSKMKFIYT